jgi:hypothetical protein
VLAFQRYGGADLGLALIRDGNSTRSFETLLSYRGAALAEFTRSLRTLKALQAERAARAPAAVGPVDRPVAQDEQPNEPEPRKNRGKCVPATSAHESGHAPAAPTRARMYEAVPPATPLACLQRGPRATEPKQNEPEPDVPPRSGGTLNGPLVPAAGLLEGPAANGSRPGRHPAIGGPAPLSAPRAQ